MKDPQSERPMNEAEWERFMQESDARSAKYGELLETFMDHPDRDAIIEREMGWDKIDPDPEFIEMVSEAEAAVEELLEAESDDEEDFEEDSEFDDDMDDPSERALVRELPVYGRAYNWGLAVHDALKPYFDELDRDYDIDLEDALVGSMTVAAKIAGGHAMGTEDEALCGNIVNCRRGLEGATRAIQGLRNIEQAHCIPAESIQVLVRDGHDVVQLLQLHITELRSRVWWE